MQRAQQALKQQARSLYRRCLRSAEACPDLSQCSMMKDYVRIRFRDRTSPDSVPLRLKDGEPSGVRGAGVREARGSR